MSPGDSPGILWAEHLRSVRESILEQMSQGTAGLAGVLAGRHDPAVGAIHLLSVLEAVPGALKVLTRRRLGELGWDPDSPIGELSDAQVEAVISEFAQPVVRQVVK